MPGIVVAPVVEPEIDLPAAAERSTNSVKQLIDMSAFRSILLTAGRYTPVCSATSRCVRPRSSRIDLSVIAIIFSFFFNIVG